MFRCSVSDLLLFSYLPTNNDWSSINSIILVLLHYPGPCVHSCCSDYSTAPFILSPMNELCQFLWLPAGCVVKTFIEKLQLPTAVVLHPMYLTPTSYSVYEIIKGRLIGFQLYLIILDLQVIVCTYSNICRIVWRNLELVRIEPEPNFVVGDTLPTENTGVL